MSTYTVHGNGSSCATLPESGYYGDLTFDNCPVKICGPFVLHGRIIIPAGCTVTMVGTWTIYYPAGTSSPQDWFFAEIDPSGSLNYSGATIQYELETGGGS